MMIIIDKNKKKLLKKYLNRKFAKIFPYDDNFRLLSIFYLISGLDLINELDDNLNNDEKLNIINSIYEHQLHPKNDDDLLMGKFGFTCQRSLIILRNNNNDNDNNHQYDNCNLILTYCALITLIILGDQLERVNRMAILRGIKYHQQNDGSFIQSLIEEENDMRVMFSATAICYILNDWTTINQELMINYIKSCQTYEMAFGQKIGAESHAGSTFCAIASLYLMEKLNIIYNEKQQKQIVEWLLNRQINGFQGRSNKDPDTCYSFWIGATLTMLNSFHFIDDQVHSEFLSTTFDNENGGFAKYPDLTSDLHHTYFGIAALSLRVLNKIDLDNNIELQSIYPALNISQRAFKHLCSIRTKWDS